MAGSTTREGAIGYADPLRLRTVGGSLPAASAASPGPFGRLTQTLLFRAGLGLLLGFLLTQPAIYLSYSEQALAQQTHAAAPHRLDADIYVQHLPLATRSVPAAPAAGPPSG